MRISNTSAYSIKIYDINLTFFYIPIEKVLANISRSGAVTRGGSVSRANSVTKSGTVTLSGNSAANTMIADLILCDVTGLYTTPADVVSHLLTTAGYGAGSGHLYGTLPAGYAVNGAITTPGRLIDWLDSIAFQCRCFFRMVAGGGYLTARPDTLTSARTIAAVVVESGKALMTWRRAPVTQVINDITLRYGRDYANVTGEPYQLTSTDTDSASITAHGRQTKDSLFRCDFITSATMADSVLAYYLTQYATRKTYVDIVVYLDQLAVSFGDVITLPDSRVGTVVSVGIQPGSVDDMDRIKLTIMI